MAGKLNNLIHKVRKIKIWLMVAAAIAVTIAGYYTLLGVRYLDASGQVPIVSARIAQFQRTIRGELPDETPLESALSVQEENLAEIRSLFSYPRPDDLVAILSSTAQIAGVGLTSITVGDAKTEVEDGIEFTVQPLSISVIAEPIPIYRWLEQLHEQIPVISVTDFRITGLDSFSSAKINLLVFLSPTTVQEDEAG